LSHGNANLRVALQRGLLQLLERHYRTGGLSCVMLRQQRIRGEWQLRMRSIEQRQTDEYKNSFHPSSAGKTVYAHTTAASAEQTEAV
jgi:hypothetical protein